MAAGAVDCLRKDQELERDRRRDPLRRRVAPMDPHRSENTAVVLDSTADFPDAQIRFPNMRVVPLYVRFGEESFRDYVELDPHGFYERLRAAAELPTTSQPTPQDFMSTYNASPATSASTRCTSRRSCRAHSRARRSPRPRSAATGSALIDTESASVGIGMLAIAIQELLARGTTDEEIEALAALHRERAASSSPSTRSSSSRRAAASAAPGR